MQCCRVSPIEHWQEALSATHSTTTLVTDEVLHPIGKIQPLLIGWNLPDQVESRDAIPRSVNKPDASGQRPGRRATRGLTRAVPAVQQVRDPRATRAEGLVRRPRSNRSAHAVDARVGAHEADLRRVAV